LASAHQDKLMIARCDLAILLVCAVRRHKKANPFKPRLAWPSIANSKKNGLKDQTLAAHERAHALHVGTTLNQLCSKPSDLHHMWLTKL
jgi:hypothetical protein